MLELKVLGPPQATLDKVGLALRPRRLALLTLLALEGPQSRSALAGLLFERLDPEAARSRIRMEVHRLVHGPLGGALQLDGDLIRVEASCDAAHFLAAVDADDLDAAITLYRGPLLDGFELDDTPALDEWKTTTRTRFLGRLTAALDAQLLQLDALGQGEAALGVARTLFGHHPLSESHAHALTDRLVTLGRWGEARAVQAEFSARFERALGFAPQTPSMPTPPRPPAGVRQFGLDHPPLVGRDALWASLDQWAAGTGGVALLIGEAGVGKSRLAHEWAAGQGTSVVVLRAEESSVDLPYAPLESLLHERRAEWETAGTRWASDLGRLLPELSGLRGEVAEPSLDAVRQLGVLAEALHFLLGAGGLLLLDDAQWCDGATLAVIRRLLSRRPAKELQILVTVRPGEDEGRKALTVWRHDLERASLLRAFEVPPLGEVAVLKVLRLISGAERMTLLARRLAEWSGGNPYALLSLLRGLFEEGRLGVDAAGRWIMPELLETSLPQRVASDLLRPVARAPLEVRRLLEAAALQGTRFDFDAAWVGSDLEEEVALAALDHSLQERSVWAEGSRYRFAHDLLRQAVAGSVNLARAERTHRRLAEHLTRVGVPAATLGRHWQGAGLRSEAARCWRRAAEDASRLFAHQEALTALEHALECTDEPQFRFDLRLSQMRHFKALNDLHGWEKVLQSAEGEVGASPAAPEDQVLPLALERTHLLWRAGEREAALTYSAPYAEGSRHPARATLLHDRAGLFLDLERHGEALRTLELAWPHVDDQAGRQAANLHNTHAKVADALGRLDEGLRHADQAVQLFETLGIWTGVASAQATTAFLQRSRGDLPAARAAVEQGVAAARRAQHLHLQVGSLNLLCEVLLVQGDWSAGLAWATAGIELCEQEGQPSGLAMFEQWLGRFKVQRGAGV